jgi:hypothetical protein
MDFYNILLNLSQYKGEIKDMSNDILNIYLKKE